MPDLFLSLFLSSLLSERGRGACCALDFFVLRHLRGGPSSSSIKRPGRVELARITSPKRSRTLSHTRRVFNDVKGSFRPISLRTIPRTTATLIHRRTMELNKNR